MLEKITAVFAPVRTDDLTEKARGAVGRRYTLQRDLHDAGRWNVIDGLEPQTGTWDDAFAWLADADLADRHPFPA